NSKEPTNKELEDKEESVEEKSIESRSMQTIENEIENLISEEDDSSEFLKENLTDNEIVNDLEEKIIEEPKLDKEEDILTTKKIDKTESELSTKMTHYSLLKQVEGLTRSKSDEKKISKESKLTNRASTSDSKKGNKQKRKRRTRIHRVIITEE
ncbi:MAG: hypothetical protein U9N34_00300, partial [Candidatus Cloacimonadota bacterium]|nr:hypothetical protein [Candidatus Cloacimonadota bacterium]